MSKKIILDVRGLPEKIEALARRLGITDFIGPRGEGINLVENPEEATPSSILITRIETPEDVNKIVETAKKGVKKILVDTKDWRVIPIENIIAELQDYDVELYARAEDPREAEMLSGILEKGVDGIILKVSDADELLKAYELIAPTPEISLRSARVVGAELVGVGDRVCIDTSSMLRVGEGCLVGNTSQFLFLVHSESIETGYVAARPFRVNAGGVHAYTLLPNGRTKYLAELKAGDDVLIVNWDGKSRRAVVGRSKIERRPLILVKARAGDNEGSILLQYAETIRLVKPGGEPVSVTELGVGDDVLVYLAEAKARHYGVAVNEFIIEK